MSEVVFLQIDHWEMVENDWKPTLKFFFVLDVVENECCCKNLSRNANVSKTRTIIVIEFGVFLSYEISRTPFE